MWIGKSVDLEVLRIRGARRGADGLRGVPSPQDVPDILERHFDHEGENGCAQINCQSFFHVELKQDSV